MQVNPNDNSSLWTALAQLFAGKPAETSPVSKSIEAGGAPQNQPAPSVRQTVLQLVAAENYLAAGADAMDFESAYSLAEAARGLILQNSEAILRGQANIAPSSVIELID